MFFIFIVKNLNITNYNMKNIIKLQTHTEAELCLHRWEQLQYHSMCLLGFSLCVIVGSVLQYEAAWGDCSCDLMLYK